MCRNLCVIIEKSDAVFNVCAIGTIGNQKTAVGKYDVLFGKSDSNIRDSYDSSYFGEGICFADLENFLGWHDL